MFAATVDQARSIAAMALIGLVLFAVLAAWLMKQVTMKVAAVVVVGVLATLIWTQRSSLGECADKVRAAGTAVSEPSVDTTCSFFGRDIEITISRNST